MSTSTNFLVLTRVFEELTGVSETSDINGGFWNPKHYQGFSEPHVLLEFFRIPCITGVFRTSCIIWEFSELQALMGVFGTPSINGDFRNPKH